MPLVEPSDRLGPGRAHDLEVADGEARRERRARKRVAEVAFRACAAIKNYRLDTVVDCDAARYFAGPSPCPGATPRARSGAPRRRRTRRRAPPRRPTPPAAPTPAQRSPPARAEKRPFPRRTCRRSGARRRRRRGPRAPAKRTSAFRLRPCAPGTRGVPGRARGPARRPSRRWTPPAPRSRARRGRAARRFCASST